MFTLKHLKRSNVFRSYSDHLQGAMLLFKVTDSKILKSVTLTRNVWAPWRWSE